MKNIIEIMTKIDDPFHTFVIAEAGSNWKAGSFEEDLHRAKQLIDVASQKGADAIKFQTFEASDLTSIHSKYYKIMPILPAVAQL